MIIPLLAKPVSVGVVKRMGRSFVGDRFVLELFQREHAISIETEQKKGTRKLSIMEQEELYILKRDGSRQLFEAEKIRSAIYKAYRAGGVRPDPSSVDVIVARIESVARAHKDGALAVEDIQDMVEQALMAADPFIAKKYIIYREWRTVERDKRTRLKHTMMVLSRSRRMIPT